MRVSLTARFVSHPTIDFEVGRRTSLRPRLGLVEHSTIYHRPLRLRRRTATIDALRPPTSRFRFPSVGSIGRVRMRRTVPSLGLPRLRRA
jgi:hypothetical protein